MNIEVVQNRVVHKLFYMFCSAQLEKEIVLALEGT
jgi:hypothetical protein